MPMPTLPKRPAPYIAALLLVVMLILTVWMAQALNSPALRRALEEKTARESSPKRPLPR